MLAAARIGTEKVTCWIGGIAERPFAVALPSALARFPEGICLTGLPVMETLLEGIADAAPDASAYRRHLAAVAACDAIADAAPGKDTA